MAGFDVSFLNPNLRKGQSKNYGFLVDQLDILKNNLESDGKLSPGDYDLLMSKAQEIYANPGLTNEQRSNVLVKISDYKQKKSTTKLSESNDIERLNRELKDDDAKNTMLFANNPQIFLEAKADAVRMKLERLSEAIDQLSSSGQDSSRHMLEYQEALNEYNDDLQALDDAKNADGVSPKSGFVAYVTTNSKGEVTDLQVGRVGSKTGYVETNGLYGGFQVYGKVNRKEFGKNIFKIGNTTFSAADYAQPDPANPGALKYNPLTADDQKTALGPFKTAVTTQYKDIDLTQVRPQSTIYPGGWAQGEKFLYKKLENGKYQKFVNTDKSKLGIDDTNVIRIPRNIESAIIPDVQETIDGSKPLPPGLFNAPMVSPSPLPADAGQQPDASQQPTGPQGSSKTPAPKTNLFENFKNVAGRAVEGARNFLGGILNR